MCVKTRCRKLNGFTLNTSHQVRKQSPADMLASAHTLPFVVIIALSIDVVIIIVTITIAVDAV